MSLYSRNSEKRKYMHDYHIRRENFAETYGRQDSVSPPMQMESEKKMRREIANNNERRRMQSINAGFAALKNIVPHHDGEKMSKAAILQSTSEYIHTLLREKEKLVSQNTQLKNLLADCGQDRICEVIYRDSPPAKRKKRDTESSDEGILQDFEDAINNNIIMEEMRKELKDTKSQLDTERQLRNELENEIREYNAKLYSHGQSRLDTYKSWESYNATHGNVNTHLTKETMLGHEQGEQMKHISDVKETVCSDTESMAQRNLKIMFEAIKHLEGGESLAVEERKDFRSAPSCEDSDTVPHSEDSDNNIKDNSESEDLKSDCSDRESPFILHNHVGFSSSIFHQRYPIASSLLHEVRPQLMYRPGVIVHKS